MTEPQVENIEQLANSPHNVVRVAQRLAYQGIRATEGNYNKYTFIGTNTTGAVEIDFFRYNYPENDSNHSESDSLIIKGSGFDNVIITRNNDSPTNKGQEYTISGTLPHDAARILQAIQPDKEAMDKLRKLNQNIAATAKKSEDERLAAKAATKTEIEERIRASGK